MDIYVIAGYGKVFGASARLQGAELIRAEVARAMAVGQDGKVADEDYRGVYDRLEVVNTELRDLED
ncbi:MAG: hypothetical protein PGN37_20430 [Mycobacterium kyogaense]|uniref:hypothetical protein n=1 Tax=Mycobacterium kyogaense TaxID=2212479 RepID=UPI002FFBEB90